MKVICQKYPADLDYLTLYPIGDVHYGAKECMEDEFKRYLLRIASDERAAVIILGDMLNNGIKSSVTNCYEEKYTPREQKIGMVNMLETVRDKIICGVRGNHERRSAKDVDVDLMEDMFRELQIASVYAKDMGILKISLGAKDKNGKPATYSFCVTHGSGGGQLLGSGLNRPDSFEAIVENIDGILSGHTHKPMKVPSGRLVFDPHNDNVIHKNTLIFVCTAWLSYGGYPECGMMKPVAFRPDTIRLDGRVKEWS